MSNKTKEVYKVSKNHLKKFKMFRSFVGNLTLFEPKLVQKVPYTPHYFQFLWELTWNAPGMSLQRPQSHSDQ